MSGTDPGIPAWLPVGRGVEVIAVDSNGLVALNKPEGVLSHPNKAGEEGRSLLNARYDLKNEVYLCETGKSLWLLNRLDSATSGVILASLDQALAEEVKAEFKRREIAKTYVALVFGRPRQSGETWRDRLAVDRREGRLRGRRAESAPPAESRMRLIRTGHGSPILSLIGLEPRTGRTHQLRVQCAGRHLPIVGDQTYGDFRKNREFARATRCGRLFLHALEISFEYPFGGRRHAFSAAAPLPGEFEAFLWK